MSSSSSSSTSSSTSSSSRVVPSKTTIYVCAGLYVVSGICQPMIMTLCKYAGLANPTAQLYMFFYYLGPALVVVPIVFCDNNNKGNNNKTTLTTTTSIPGSSSSSSSSIRKAIITSSSIAMFDIIASAMNYTGASLAGPTVFAIIYSSVTIWTAVFSRLFLHRRMILGQWIAVFTVFGGLCITASNSAQLGPDITKGTILVVVGSMMHGGTYCMNEAIMTITQQTLSVKQNTAVQGCTAAFVMGLWQLVYTIPRYDELIEQPMQNAGTSLTTALAILVSFMVANLVHSVTYYHTLKFYAGGATSAGAFKGLQAVLVFVAAHVLYCNHYNIGGTEMCFSSTKFISLVTVCGGVAVYGYLTEKQQQHDQQQEPQWQSVSSSSSSSPLSCLRSLFRLHNNKKQGYTTIPHGYDDDDDNNNNGGGNCNGGGIVEVEAIHV